MIKLRELEHVNQAFILENCYAVRLYEYLGAFGLEIIDTFGFTKVDLVGGEEQVSQEQRNIPCNLTSILLFPRINPHNFGNRKQVMPHSLSCWVRSFMASPNPIPDAFVFKVFARLFVGLVEFCLVLFTLCGCIFKKKQKK